MTSDFSSARLGIAVRINLKSFIAENALPAQTSLFGSAFWLKTGTSEVNCRIQKNLRLDLVAVKLHCTAGIFRPRRRLLSVADVCHSFKIAPAYRHDRATPNRAIGKPPNRVTMLLNLPATSSSVASSPW